MLDSELAAIADIVFAINVEHGTDVIRAITSKKVQTSGGRRKTKAKTSKKVQASGDNHGGRERRKTKARKLEPVASTRQAR